MHDRFRDELSRMKTPFIVVSGPHERRFAEAVTAIDAILVC
jgi:HTH-type transcriptional regulator, transcriptional repressor of NAD biosynthesis genes